MGTEAAAVTAAADTDAAVVVEVQAAALSAEVGDPAAMLGSAANGLSRAVAADSRLVSTELAPDLTSSESAGFSSCITNSDGASSKNSDNPERCLQARRMSVLSSLKANSVRNSDTNASI